MDLSLLLLPGFLFDAILAQKEACCQHPQFTRITRSEKSQGSAQVYHVGHRLGCFVFTCSLFKLCSFLNPSIYSKTQKDLQLKRV